ncbi:UDP-N-acetylmuramoylalanine--D-glutamate ligase [hydrothermal vent metagenome]|uniref:UDP-N-acetylmuramoylalanine--D-glutamate ligase n=1 Tax=hydrothermal vent metagenome TaxID=652676 RepID=A0A3B0VN00_9ZZZZ
MYMDASSFFRGKRITVMGLGLLGRGVGDVKYLAESGAELIVTDLKSKEQLAESLTQLESFPDITFVLGEHRLEDFRDRDFILKAAGVPIDSPYIDEARKNNIPVRMSADLFMELSGVTSIGITGTRGKSTVTHMLYAILKESGVKVLIGGNVRGVSTLSLLSEATPEHVAVLELDSWQCQGLGEANMSADTAVFTTFYPDHTNYYKNDLSQYLSDKSNIFLYQSPDNIFVIGSQCAPILIEAYGENIVGNTIIADENTLPKDWKLAIPGKHNRYDAGIALAVARTQNVDDNVSKRALENFNGVPGRLERIAEKNGVVFYNDTTATTPEATLSALSSLNPKHTVLIMGGSDKELDMSILSTKLPEVKYVAFLAGSGTNLMHVDFPNTKIFDSLKEAFADAVSHASEGDYVILSPAFASFGMFENEFDRGDKFVEIVKEYTA